MTRSHLVLAVILGAVVALCISGWVNEGPLWRWMVLKEQTTEESGGWLHRKLFGNHRIRVRATVKRWSDPPIPHGKAIGFYTQNGFKALEGEFRNGLMISVTIWNFDGTVAHQGVPGPDKTSPPWLWGVKDQTQPSAPWWNEKQ